MIKRLFPFVKIISFCLILTFSQAVGQKRPRHKAPRQVASQTRHGAPKTSPKVESQATSTKYVPVHKYDPARNPEQDIQDAVAEARREAKRILLEVGGEWCIWCHIMDTYFENHPELLALREKNFIMVKINFSEENKNEQVLSRYPPVTGYPHIFVLDEDGKLLHSQDTGKLEEGKSYNLEKFTAFLKEWSPPGRESKTR